MSRYLKFCGLLFVIILLSIQFLPAQSLESRAGKDQDEKRFRRITLPTTSQTRRAQAEETQMQSIINDLKKRGYSDEKILESLRSLGYDVSELDEFEHIEKPAYIDSLQWEWIKIQNEMIEAMKEEFPEFDEAIQADTIQILKPYGYDFFKFTPVSFEPAAYGLVDPDYPLGPGDEVQILIWGDAELNQSSIVDRTGSIFIRNVGRISVNGVKFGNLQGLIEQRLRPYFSGIENGTTHIDVSIGRLRQIQVFITGDVKITGGFHISGLSTVLNALYYSGGITEIGSLRDIQVLRNNRTAAVVDLYQFLLRGDNSGDIRLQNNDVVFVPTVSKRVKVTGEVRRPSIYEIRAQETIQDVIEFAGHFTELGFPKRVNIFRYLNQVTEQGAGIDRTLISVDFTTEQGKHFQVQPGDSIHVVRKQPRFENYVRLDGAVARPGIYQFTEGLTLSHILSRSEGLLPEAYLEYASLVRTHADSTRESLTIPLHRITEDHSVLDVRLQARDYIHIYSQWDIVPKDSVEVSGAVNVPGRYELFENMTVLDLILQAGGMTEDALSDRMQVSRNLPYESGKQLADIFELTAHGDGVNTFERFILAKEDHVSVWRDPSFPEPRRVKIIGEVVYPGQYLLQSETEKFSQLLHRAGGLKETAYPDGIRFFRKENDIGEIAINIDRILEDPGSIDDLILFDGDSISVPEYHGTVQVMGEVGFPTNVLWESGADLSYYIERAGGYTKDADKGRVKIILANGQIRRPKRFWPDPSINAGSQIVIPKMAETDKRDWGAIIAQTTQIVSGLVTTIFILDQIINNPSN